MSQNGSIDCKRLAATQVIVNPQPLHGCGDFSQACSGHRCLPIFTMLLLFLILLGHGSAQAEILLGQNLSTGKGLGNLQTDPEWRVAYKFQNQRDLETRVLSAPHFPFGKYWLPPSQGSNWLSPNLPAFTQKNAPSGTTGLYQNYYVRFFLTPHEANTAYIAGLNGETARWTSDNNGLRIVLNNHIVWNGNTRPQAYRKWHAVKPIATGFQVGWNTLEFVIRNNPVLSQNTALDLKHSCHKTVYVQNPTAFRFEAGLYYDPGPPPPAVPEPASLILYASGVGLLALFGSIRRFQSSRPSSSN